MTNENFSKELSQEQISAIVDANVVGSTRPAWDRYFICFMAGYLRFADDIESTRQQFFKQLKKELERKDCQHSTKLTGECVKCGERL